MKADLRNTIQSLMIERLQSNRVKIAGKFVKIHFVFLYFNSNFTEVWSAGLTELSID